MRGVWDPLKQTPSCVKGQQVPQHSGPSRASLTSPSREWAATHFTDEQRKV